MMIICNFNDKVGNSRKKVMKPISAKASDINAAGNEPIGLSGSTISDDHTWDHEVADDEGFDSVEISHVVTKSICQFNMALGLTL